MSEETLEGTVERITFYSEDTGYTVLRLAPNRLIPSANLTRGGVVTVVGNLPEVVSGEALRLEGRWTTHPRHGRQFRADHCERVRPTSLKGIQRYLGSGLIKGIGPVTAERIVEVFGEDTLKVIEEDVERLREVEGVGDKRIEIIRKAWQEQRAIQDVMIFLQGIGVSTRLAVKIYKTYGEEAIARVQRDPYRLARDIWGIGFLTADRIAKAMGVAPDAPSRLQAGVQYALDQALDEGHVFLPRKDLVNSAAQLLGVAGAGVEEALDQLLAEGTCVAGEDQAGADESIYQAAMYYAEIGAAKRLLGLLQEPASRLAGMEVEETVQWIAEGDWELSARQLQAVQKAFSYKVSLLTGGPGTGKTTTLQALVEALDRAGRQVALAAPTGRAAKRMSEATGHPAKTIHRMLGFKPTGGFERDEDNPLGADLVVIDEASMLDVVLANSLFKAVHPASHLLLVGDANQLPSVGPGDVLRDVVESGVVPVTRLTTIFRQAERSMIVRNAHRVNAGRTPRTPKEASDFFLFVERDPEEARELIVDIVRRRIPAKFGLDPMRDIQVIAPMYRGPVGVTEIGNALQRALNAGTSQKSERRLGSRVFRAGDKVMQTRNNYQKDVYNGDIGLLEAIRDEDQEALVRFDDDRSVVYDFAEMDELVHAYCISVHKSQGSEYPCVVMPIMTTHYVMLQRNLLYTAITRARQLVVLVGTRKAIAIAVKNNQVAQRHSGLAARLRDRAPEEPPS